MKLYSLQACEVEKTVEPSSEIEGEERRRLLWDALATLPPWERDALVGKAGLEGNSCRAVARRYGVCPQTACNWAAAAAKKLRPLLEGVL